MQKQAQELETQRQQLAAQNGYRDDKGFTAEDYEDAAVRLDNEGDTGLARTPALKLKSLKRSERTGQDQLLQGRAGSGLGSEASGIDEEQPGVA